MAESLTYAYSSEEFKKLVEESNSFRDLLKKVGYKTVNSATVSLLKRRIEEEELDISHFGTTKSYHKVLKEDVFKKDSDVSQRTLRKWYLKEDIPYKCSICGQSDIWQEKPLTLILDHINGNNTDNQLSNLRWVCPNCNQQLETTGFKKFRTENDVYGTFKLRKKIQKNNTVCPKCGKYKSLKAKLCNSCAAKERIIPIEEMPITREELKNLIRTMSFVSIGTKYHVSDNTIRKWCDKFNLPRRSSDIKKISDEEWIKI